MKKLSITLPESAVHHALKWLPALTLVQAPLEDIHGRHWALVTAFYALTVVMGLLLAAAVMHSLTPHLCPRCTPKDPTALKRRRYRAAMFYGRHGAPMLAIPAVLTFAALPLLFPEDGNRDKTYTELNPTGEAVYVGAAFICCSYLAALRFYRQHSDPASRGGFHQRNKGFTHRAHLILLGFAPVQITLLFLAKDGVLLSLLSLSSAVFFFLFFLESRHSRSLCEQCIATWRTDAPEYAAKNRWRFSAVHKFMRPLEIISAFAALVLIATSDSDALWWRSLRAVPYVMWAAGGMLYRFHSAYQPWCPWCRGGGGGGAHEEVPDPTPQHGRPLPVT